MKFIALAILTSVYLAYIMIMTWGAGKLATKMNKEVEKTHCKIECKVTKQRKQEPTPVCKEYCKELK